MYYECPCVQDSAADASTPAATEKSAESAESATTGDVTITDKTTTDTRISKGEIVKHWLDRFRTAGGGTSRAPTTIKTFMLKVELDLVDLARKDPATGSFVKKRGKKTVVAEIKGTKKHGLESLQYVLGGAIGFERTKQSYLCATFGPFELRIDGTADSDFPYMGWNIPTSSDETEVAMEVEDVTVTVAASSGSSKVQIPVAFKILKLKDSFHGTTDAVLVRPQMESETITKFNKAKKKSAAEVFNDLFTNASSAASSGSTVSSANGTAGKRPGGPGGATSAAAAKKARTSSDEEKLGDLAFLLANAADKQTGELLLAY